MIDPKEIELHYFEDFLYGIARSKCRFNNSAKIIHFSQAHLILYPLYNISIFNTTILLKPFDCVYRNLKKRGSSCSIKV